MSEKELPQNLWDSIQVEMGAELESVKITLGELKAIAKGQVMDLHSIYNTKVSLLVENQEVARGDLVIVNDRYGVKIDEVMEVLQGDYMPSSVREEIGNQINQEGMTEDVQPEEAAPNTDESQEAAPQEGSEEFDYSDFNLDEQDI